MDNFVQNLSIYKMGYIAMAFSSSNRVVVTGMGVVSPCGIGVDAFWDSVINCKSGIGPITRFDASDFPVKIAGEVKDFDMRDYFGSKCRAHRYSNQTQFGLVACKQALEQAKLSVEFLKTYESVPVIMGVASSGNHLFEEVHEVLKEKGPRKVPLTVRGFPPAATAGAISQFFGFQVSATTISSCCPSGLDAVYEATRMIREGRSDIVLAGAADSYVTPVTVAAFSAVSLTSSSSEFAPEEICRPFDLQRTGGVFSEGAGFLVLERLDSALARGVTCFMEIISGARYSDTADVELLDGMSKSMDFALKNGSVYPDQIDYICADAASQITMDAAEVKMIKRVFGEHAYRIPVSSIRGVMGHGLASAGLMQIVSCAMAMKSRLIIPTANLTTPDAECDLDHVPLISRSGSINTAIINSRGMAKENSTLVVRRIE